MAKKIPVMRAIRMRCDELRKELSSMSYRGRRARWLSLRRFEPAMKKVIEYYWPGLGEPIPLPEIVVAKDKDAKPKHACVKVLLGMPCCEGK